MADVKLGNRVFTGVEGVGLRTTDGEMTVFGGDKGIISAAEFDKNVILDFSNVISAENYIVDGVS